MTRVPGFQEASGDAFADASGAAGDENGSLLGHGSALLGRLYRPSTAPCVAQPIPGFVPCPADAAIEHRFRAGWAIRGEVSPHGPRRRAGSTPPESDRCPPGRFRPARIGSGPARGGRTKFRGLRGGKRPGAQLAHLVQRQQRHGAGNAQRRDLLAPSRGLGCRSTAAPARAGTAPCRIDAGQRLASLPHRLAQTVHRQRRRVERRGGSSGSCAQWHRADRPPCRWLPHPR